MRLPKDLLHFPTNLVYLAGLLYGLVLSMASTLIPLYLLDLGYGAADIGIVVSSQGLLQVLLQFAGGVVSDRFGQRVVIGFGFAAYATGVVAIVNSPLYAVVVLAQMLIGASRAVYWVAAQSYVSRSFPGSPGTVLGRLLSFESSGIAIGGVIAGIEATVLGFNAAFMTCASICVLGLVAVLVLPELPRSASVRTLRDSLAPIPVLLRSRPIVMAGMIAVAASLSSALVASLYSVYFTQLNLSKAFIGGLLSLNAVGTVVVAFSFGAILSFMGVRWVMAFGLVLTGLLTIGTAVAGDVPWAAALVMLCVGGTFGALRVLYPAIAAGNSIPEQRGVALSAAAFYWGLGQLLVPATFGFVAEYLGAVGALWIGGGVLVIFGVLSPFVYKWLMKPV